MSAIIILFILLLMFFALESIASRSAIKKIPIRILVNGTRGKTSICRLLGVALNDADIKTYIKTTGTSAEIVNSLGMAEKIKRRKGARLEENIAFMRKAAKNGAECVVLECMALKSENQRMMARHFARPTHTIIANTLRDHAAEMGEDKLDVISSLSASILEGTKLYVTEPYYDSADATITHVAIKHYDTATSIPMHDENISIALRVLEDLTISAPDALKSFSKALADKGLVKDFLINESYFAPSFAINDYESMVKEIRRLSFKRKGKTTLLFNNRKDREYRILYVRDAIKECNKEIDKVYIVGDYKNKVKRYLKKHTKAEIYAFSDDEMVNVIKNHKANYVALGNIKGSGEKILSALEEDLCFIQQ